MHPLLSNLRGTLAYLSACLLAGLAWAAAWPQAGEDGFAWALAFAWPVAVMVGAVALMMYPVCRSQPLRPARWISAWSRRALAAGLLALLSAGAAALWNLTGLVADRAGLVTLPPAAWLTLLGLMALVYAMSALAHDALLAQQAAQHAATTEAQARLLAREMELKALRHQIAPHFLFNSLNAISALTRLDPAAARAMTIDLADFFRQTLSLDGRERIRIEEELQLVQRYLAIEQRRLGDKARLQLDVGADCLQGWLPPLLLQPLVENAVKHGMVPAGERGAIALQMLREGRRLHITLSNPVDPAAPRDASGLGQGLRHLRERLALLYAEPAVVDVTYDADRFILQLSLPWES